MHTLKGEMREWQNEQVCFGKFIASSYNIIELNWMNNYKENREEVRRYSIVRVCERMKREWESEKTMNESETVRKEENEASQKEVAWLPVHLHIPKEVLNPRGPSRLQSSLRIVALHAESYDKAHPAGLHIGIGVEEKWRKGYGGGQEATATIVLLTQAYETRMQDFYNFHTSIAYILYLIVSLWIARFLVLGISKIALAPPRNK